MSLDLTDSTTNNLIFSPSGSGTPNVGTGQINGAADFFKPGFGNSGLLGAHNSVLDSIHITLSAWVKLGIGGGGFMSIVDRDNASTARVFQFRHDAVSNALQFIAFVGGVQSINGSTPGNITDGVWHYTAGTFDGAHLKIYVDGIPDATPVAVSGSLDVSTTVGVGVGGSINNSTFWQGEMDEVRQSNVARSADWIKTEYNNQNDPASFITVGPETTVSGAYRRSLTIDHTLVPNTDQTDFPVLVYISDPTLKFHAFGVGGHVVDPIGNDILFWSDSGATIQLPSEIKFDGVHGILWAWVQIPTVSHTSNIVFYVTYGLALALRLTNPWDGNYVFVLHLDGSALASIGALYAAKGGTYLSGAGGSAGAVYH